MKLTIFLLVINLTFSIKPSEDNRLYAFLDKVEKLFKTNRIHESLQWEIPNHLPSITPPEMPNIEIYTRDHETGLLYSSFKKKIRDEDLEIAMDVEKGIVYDFKTGKQYLLDELMTDKEKLHKIQNYIPEVVPQLL
jgi:hypothetical protein